MIDSFSISNFIENLSKSCSQVQSREFEKGEIVTTYLVNRRQVCLLASGSVDLIRYDFKGNKDIVEHFTQNAVFGEIFYQINTNNELFCIAREKSKVLFFSYDIFGKKCKNNCKFHQELTENLPNLILSKISDLNLRIELLSKRTIREKLLSYFSILSEKNFSKSFILPFSLTDLADYLSVDRSAMMRELKLLKDDQIIKKTDNKITLLLK